MQGVAGLIKLARYCKHHIEYVKPCPASPDKAIRLVLSARSTHRFFMNGKEYGARCVEVSVKKAFYDLNGCEHSVRGIGRAHNWRWRYS